MLTVASLSLLAIWLAISVLAQFDSAPTRAIKRHDLFSLLPRWSFFAPRPGVYDYHLLYRDLRSDGTLGAWREIPLADERTIGGALWNPEKRCRKALSDTVRSLNELLRSGPKPSLALTMPYLTILNYVTSRGHEPQTTATQFLILRTDGFMTGGDPRLVFQSDLHRTTHS